MQLSHRTLLPLQVTDAMERVGRRAASQPAVVLHSGHDNTVMPFLVAYGVEPQR